MQKTYLKYIKHASHYTITQKCFILTKQSHYVFGNYLGILLVPPAAADEGERWRHGISFIPLSACCQQDSHADDLDYE